MKEEKKNFMNRHIQVYMQTDLLLTRFILVKNIVTARVVC